MRVRASNSKWGLPEVKRVSVVGNFIESRNWLSIMTAGLPLFEAVVNLGLGVGCHFRMAQCWHSNMPGSASSTFRL